MIKGYSHKSKHTKAAHKTAHSSTAKNAAPSAEPIVAPDGSITLPAQKYKSSLKSAASVHGVTPLTPDPLAAAFLQRNTIDTTTDPAALQKAQNAFANAQAAIGSILTPQDAYANTPLFFNKLLLNANSATKGETDVKKNQQTILNHPKKKRIKKPQQIIADKLTKKDVKVPINTLPSAMTVLNNMNNDPTYYAH